MDKIELAICSLEMLRALMLFDPLTGEDISLDSLNRDNRELYDSADVAITALTEQAERSKGCVWCKVGQNNARTVWIDGSFDAFTGDSYGEGASRKGIIDRKVAYCPMCGKRLEAQHEQN